MRYHMIGALAALMVVAGCGPKSEDSGAPPAPTSSPASSSVAPSAPDVGKLDSVTTTAIGLGQTAGEAMAEAMKMALLQVNGAMVQSESVSAKYGLDVSLNQDSASLRASAFAELVRQKSGGVIQNGYTIKLQNRERVPAALAFSVENLPGAQIEIVGHTRGDLVLDIGPDTVASFRVLVRAPRAALKSDSTPIVMKIKDKDREADADTSFRGPAR